MQQGVNFDRSGAGPFNGPISALKSPMPRPAPLSQAQNALLSSLEAEDWRERELPEWEPGHVMNTRVFTLRRSPCAVACFSGE